MIVLAMTTKAQDTIIFRNGDIKSVKVTEVSETQIKYLRWNSPDGPVYVQDVSDIYMIKYHDGTKEVYGNGTDIAEREQEQDNNLGVYQGQLKLDGSRLMLNGKALSYPDARSLLGIHRYETFFSASHQVAVGGICLAFGLIMTTIGLVCVCSQQGELILPGFGMLVVSDVLLPIGFIFSGVGKGRMKWVVNDYNRNGSQLSQDFSVSVSPSLVCVPTATGNNYSLGAGLQLHF